MILERRLTPSCLKIQNQYRRRKATKYVARVRKAKALALARKRAKKIAADRRRKANQTKRDAMEAKHQAKLRARKREISKLLVKQLSNPTWETLNALLTEGNTALGEAHDLMVRGTRLLKALEKESAFQHYRKKKGPQGNTTSSFRPTIQQCGQRIECKMDPRNIGHCARTAKSTPQFNTIVDGR